MKKHTIGVPCTPSTMLDHTEQRVTRFLLSYGGGMGGSTKTYYATEVIPVNDREIKIKTIDESEPTINPNFVVESEPMRCIKLVTDTTSHRNNGEIRKRVLTEYFVMKLADTYQISNQYTGRHETGHCKMIHSETEIDK
jgi:hypothetical protein